MKITSIKARKIQDSRNQPTIEVTLNSQKASAPSGKSTGKYETPPYHNTLEWNIKFLNQFKPNLDIKKLSDLEKLEYEITKKAKLSDPKQFGANALFALESAILKALAKNQEKQLWQIINPKAKKFPILLGNAVGGGLHSNNPGKPEFQEFLIIPSESSFKSNIKTLDSTHNKLKSILN